VGSTEQGCLFMAMEYIRGESLAQLIHSTGGLDEARAVNIAVQILRSLRPTVPASSSRLEAGQRPPPHMARSRRRESGRLRHRRSTSVAQVRTLTVWAPPLRRPELLRAPRSDTIDIYAMGLVLRDAGGPQPVPGHAHRRCRGAPKQRHPTRHTRYRRRTATGSPHCQSHRQGSQSALPQCRYHVA
jgi:hypothetical protein